MKTDIALIRQDITYIKEGIDSIRAGYVTTTEFKPIVKQVEKLQDNLTWLIRLVVASVVTAVMALVIVIR